jgi:hypothetical protein
VYFKDTSLVVQGVDTELTPKTLCVYFLFGQIIASTWNMLGNFSEVVQHVTTNGIYNNQNVFYHIQTVLHGLRKVTTLRAIKLRSDELYLDLVPIVEKMRQFPDKLVTTNIFLRKVWDFPYHCSDHIFAGQTKNILRMFLASEQLIHNRMTWQSLKIFTQPFWVPEQILSIGYMLNFYPLYALTREACPFLMNHHFTSVPVYELMPYHIVFTNWIVTNEQVYGKKVVVDEYSLQNHLCKICDLDSYEDLWNACK